MSKPIRDLDDAKRRHPSYSPQPPAWLRSDTVEQCARCHRLVGPGELVLADAAATHCELCGHTVWASWWREPHQASAPPLTSPACGAATRQQHHRCHR